MSRMKCIGAQSIAVTEKTAPMVWIEMRCRRDSGFTEHRTYHKPYAVDAPTTCPTQLCLFDANAPPYGTAFPGRGN
jgi:hypothetical protein